MQGSFVPCGGYVLSKRGSICSLKVGVANENIGQRY